MSNYNNKADARIKESKAIKLRLAGKTFEQIAEEVGYSDRASAYMRTMNAIRREMTEDITQIRELEIARLDALMESLWPVATGDLDLVRQFIDAKKMVPLRDEDGAEIVYVVPSLAKLEAIAKVLKLMERRSKFLGLDHADGLMERAVRVEEDKFAILASWVDLAAQEAGLSPEQERALKAALAKQARELTA